MTPHQVSIIQNLKEPHRQQLSNLAGGLPGINQTLQVMRSLVNRYKINPKVRELALSVIANLPQKDFENEINKLFEFVKYRIRYVRDIAGVETVQTPVKTLQYAAGDCDDKAVLLATLLESIGHVTRFHAVGFKPDHISHVLLEVKRGGEWIALDTTEPVKMGWRPPSIVTSMYG